MIQRYYEKLWDIRRRRAAGEEVGFTLIELLIVIVVLGILAATVIFALSGVTASSAVAACNSDAKSVEVAVAAFQAQNNGANPAAQSASSHAVLTPNYLQTWPNNSNYTITTSGGTVLVATTANTTPTDYNSATNPCAAA